MEYWEEQLAQLLHTLRGTPGSGQAGPLEGLRAVDSALLPKKDRHCAICYEAFHDTRTLAVDYANLYTPREKSPSAMVTSSDPVLLFPIEATATSCVALGGETAEEREQRQRLGTSRTEHDAVRLPACGHMFGRSCILEWFASHASCPLCRAVVNPDPQARRLYHFGEATALPNYASPSNRMDDPLVTFPTPAGLNRGWPRDIDVISETRYPLPPVTQPIWDSSGAQAQSLAQAGAQVQAQTQVLAHAQAHAQAVAALAPGAVTVVVAAPSVDTTPSGPPS